MQHASAYFTGSRGGQIHYHCWQPDQEVSAVIVIAHGAAEHGGRYKQFAEAFTRRNYAVVAIDFDGHGLSDGGRCCVRSMDDFVSDLTTLQQRVSVRFPDKPVVLLGHSMGGLVACALLLEQQDQYAACVLSGAAFETLEPTPGFQVALVGLLSKVTPNLGVLQLDPQGISRDPRQVQRYVDDPLNYSGRLTVRMVAELFRLMKRVRDRASEIRLPVLIMHGEQDAMTSPTGSEQFYANVGSSDKQLHLVPNAYHEIFNEPERDELFREIDFWLAQRLHSPDSSYV